MTLLSADRSNTVDVLVVGAGPAGGSAAKKLSGAGLQVLVVDRKSSPGKPMQCAEFVPLPAMQYLQGGQCIVQKIAGMITRLPSGKVVTSPFAGLMLDRTQLDKAILDIAIKQGAAYWPASTLTNLDDENKVATIRRQSGPARSFHKVRYKILIAADGAVSKIGALLKLSPLPLLHTRQYTVPLYQQGNETQIWLSRDLPGGYAWLFPKGDVAHLGVGLQRDFVADSNRDLKHSLDGLHGRLVKEGVLGERIDYQTGGALPVGGIRDSLVYNDVLFVGDAAGLAHPVSGAGILPAIQSGELAGDAVLSYLGNDKGSLEEYRQEVHLMFQESWQHALQQRGLVKKAWRCSRDDDQLFEPGWIAFDAYYNANFYGMANGG